jgi:hypothetical protein
MAKPTADKAPTTAGEAVEPVEQVDSVAQHDHERVWSRAPPPTPRVGSTAAAAAPIATIADQPHARRDVADVVEETEERGRPRADEQRGLRQREPAATIPSSTAMPPR